MEQDNLIHLGRNGHIYTYRRQGTELELVEHTPPSLWHTIAFEDMEEFREALARTENVDSVDGFTPPLCTAITYRRYDMADELLARGANPNYRSSERVSHMMVSLTRNCSHYETRLAVRYLLYHGSHIPRGLSSVAKMFVDEYVFRHWTPESHASWPVALKKQVVALLSVLHLRPFLFVHLMQFVVSAHFVWDDAPPSPD